MMMLLEWIKHGSIVPIYLGNQPMIVYGTNFPFYSKMEAWFINPFKQFFFSRNLKTNHRGHFIFYVDYTPMS